MDKGFRKFKRKVRAAAIVRSVLTGLSLGVLIVAVQWLLAKLTAADPNLVQYALLGGGIALAVCAVMLLFTLPTDKRLAKRLDNQLGLNEKVQTMVAFRQDESDMAAMQRENADEVLQQIPGKKLKSRHGWLVAILPVLACGCMVAALLVPAQAKPVDPVDTTSWLLNMYDEQKLKDLIEYVSTSAMQEEPKQAVVTELETLLAQLKTINKKVVMQEAVVQSISDIHAATLVCDTFSKVLNAMENTPSETVTTLAASLGSLSDLVITPYLETLTAQLNKEGGAEQAALIAAGIDQALTNSKEDPGNPLYAALAEFSANLKTVTDATTEAELTAMMKAADASLNQALKQPGIDIGVKKYTILQLMSIFGISSSSLPEDILGSFEEDEVISKPTKPDEDDKEFGTSGGAGPAEMVAPSDDSIFDPELEQYVKYIEVIGKYMGIISGYQEDGTMTPELEEIVSDYLAILQRVEQDSTKDEN